MLAAPWIAVLMDAKRPTQDRFDAVEELARYPIPDVTGALGQTLSDPNLRLARFAWKKLLELTEWDLPFDAEAWRDALEIRAKLHG